MWLSGALAGNDVRADVSVADFRRPRWAIDVEAVGVDLDALLGQPWLARWNDDATPFEVSFLRELMLGGQLRPATAQARR